MQKILNSIHYCFLSEQQTIVDRLNFLGDLVVFNHLYLFFVHKTG